MIFDTLSVFLSIRRSVVDPLRHPTVRLKLIVPDFYNKVYPVKNLYYLCNVILIFRRRNCKANPNCFNCLGEKFWLGEIKGILSLVNHELYL